MKIETCIVNIGMMLFLWIISFVVYMRCNKGIASVARGQQLRRYMLASICACIPMTITYSNPIQPTFIMILAVSLMWIITYPLLYHLTNRKFSTDYDNRMDIALGIYIYGLLTGMLVVIPNMKNFIWIIELILLALPVSQWIYYIVCKECINTNGMKMLQETHYNEIIEFLRSYHPIKVIAFAIAILGLCALCFIFNIYFPFNSTHAISVQTAIAAGVTLFIGIYILKPNHGIFTRTGVAELYKIVKEYVYNNRQYISDFNKRMETLDVEPLSKPSKHPSTIIMVIGESASRDFMSAFSDTDINTTPWLKDMGEDKEHCIIFNNAYSCDVQTVPTLEKALTEYNQYDGGVFFKSCSIVDIAHKLGWQVHWYSNQGHLGAADTPITLVAETSDVAKWTKQELNKVQYDESLLNFLDEIDPQKNNMVVIHLKGSHFNFENRFPETQRQWGKHGDNDNITNYKNSIHYTDTILKRLHRYGCEKLNLQAMVYFSDHGCVPDRHRLPNFGGFGDTRIPLMVWMSEEYISIHPQRAKALKDNKHQFWTNDLAYELMCGIMDIKSKHFKEYNSLASDKYRYTRDMLVAMNGKIKISDDELQ